MEIFKLFGTILIDNTQANQQLDETDTRAQKVGRTLGSMITTAAKWGAGIVAAAGAAGGALLALANKTGQAGDALVNASKRAGTTTTAYQELRFALTQVGVAESDVSLALQRLNQRVGEAEEGSSKYAKALERLGVSTRNANGEIKTSDDLFMELVTRLHQVEDSQLQAALAGEIFGVNLAQRLLPAIQAGGEELVRLRNRAHELGIVMDEEGVQAAADFASMMDEVRQMLGSIGQRVMLTLMPIFRDWLQWTIEHAPKIGAVFQFIGEVIEIVIRHTRRALEPWVALIGSILGVAWDWTVNLVGDAWRWLTTTTWAEKWEDIKRWLTAGWDWLINIAGTAWAWLDEKAPGVTSFLERFWGFIDRAWDWTVNTLGTAWRWLTETTWAEKWQDVKRWLTSGWNWTINILGKAWDWLTETTWTQKIADVRGWLSSAWSWTVNLLGKLWNWLDEKAPWATNTIRTIRDWLLSAWSWTVDLVGDFWRWLDEKAPWLTSTLETVWNWLIKLWTWEIGILGKAWDWLVGTTLQEKLADIKAIFDSAWTWTVAIAGKAWEWLTGTTLSEKLADIKGWIAEAWDWVVNTAGKAWEWLDERYPALTGALETVWNWFQRAWAWTISAPGKAWEWLDEKFPALTNALSTVWSWLERSWEWTLSFVGDAWDWLKDTAWPWLKGTAETTWNWTLGFLGQFWDWLRNIAWPWLSKTASTVWNWSLELLGEFWTWFRETAWPVIVSGAKSAWGFTLNLLGEAWDWLRNVAWPILSQGVATVWDWTMDAAGAVWDWITGGGWQDTLEGIQTGFAALPGTIAAYVSMAVQAVYHWLGDRLEGVVDFIINTVLRITNFFQALKDGLIRRTIDMVSGVLQWFIDLKDRGLEAVQGLAEGIQEWWSETKIGKAFNWMGEQVRGVTAWFADMYDKVVGHSYIPDMVEEIGQAIERLKERLANPVARYTMQALQSFENLEEGAVASMMRIAEAMDDALKSIGNQISRWIGDTTRMFFNGTATWGGIIHGFAGAIGGAFGAVFNALTQELVKNILAQNEWLVSTLANIATSVTAFLSQAYAALVGFFWFLGPAAPVAAAGVIGAAIAGIAAIGGQIVRGILPSPPSGGGMGDVSGGGGGGGRGPSAGRQVSEITGPTRDLLTDLLSPLANLGSLTGIGERIYNLLDERLPTPGTAFAGIGAGSGPGVIVIDIDIEEGAVQVTAPVGTATEDPRLTEELAQRLAEIIVFRLRGLALA